MNLKSSPPPPITATDQSSLEEARNVNSVVGFFRYEPIASANQNDFAAGRVDPGCGSDIRSEWAPLSAVEINFTVGVYPRQHQIRAAISEPVPRLFVVIPLSVVLVNTGRNILWDSPERGAPIAAIPETFTAAGIAAAVWAEEFLAR